MGGRASSCLSERRGCHLHFTKAATAQLDVRRPHALERRKVERFTVTYLGVPIGSVDLPERRDWAGGWLEAFAAADAVRGVLSPVARRDLAELLIALERDAALVARHVPPELQEAFTRAAALEFGLLNPAGIAVPQAVVRLADSGAARLHVRAYFARAEVRQPAQRVGRPPSGGEVGPRSA